MGNQLLEMYKQRGVLIAAHRGVVGGNIVQNTLPAFWNALRHKADIIEIDVALSQDGVLFPFHHQAELRVFGKNFDIHHLCANEITSLECINSLGEKSGQYLSPLSEIMIALKQRDCLVNIDRGWFSWEETLDFIECHNLEKKVVVKSPVEKRYLEVLEKDYPQIMYMPIIERREDYQLVCDYQLNIVACEMIFKSQEDALLDMVNELKERGLLTWVNAISLGREYNLSAFLDDNHAIIEGYQSNWGRLVELGFNIIQTDWPLLLKNYLET